MKLGLHVARFTYPGGADDLRRIVVAGEAAGYDRARLTWGNRGAPPSGGAPS
jgi:hypothetical protein